MKIEQMKSKVTVKVGDTLYKVDPKRLSINAFRIFSDEKINFTTTTYEDFSLSCEKRRLQLPFDQFPFEFKGLLYFLNEDDAKNYIKTQIGM
ncbi:MAG: hypothetical protein LBN74_06710 [Prevotella sp.]|jgi:hypothetical protein|nr:hypothetical protein [Prevotella sp.]